MKKILLGLMLLFMSQVGFSNPINNPFLDDDGNSISLYSYVRRVHSGIPMRGAVMEKTYKESGFTYKYRFSVKEGDCLNSRGKLYMEGNFVNVQLTPLTTIGDAIFKWICYE